jgi:hypothetical protein
MLSRSHRGLLGVVALAGGLFPAASSAAPAVVGTLTCTAEPAGSATPAEGAGGWRVSCAFEQVGKGSVQHYGGQLEGLRTGPRAAGKALLIWNVLAEAGFDPGGLVGTYKASTAPGGPGARSLVGGQPQPVILQPVNADPAAVPAVDLLQLELPKA